MADCFTSKLIEGSSQDVLYEEEGKDLKPGGSTIWPKADWLSSSVTVNPLTFYVVTKALHSMNFANIACHVIIDRGFR